MYIQQVLALRIKKDWEKLNRLANFSVGYCLGTGIRSSQSDKWFLKVASSAKMNKVTASLMLKRKNPNKCRFFSASLLKNRAYFFLAFGHQSSGEFQDVELISFFPHYMLLFLYSLLTILARKYESSTFRGDKVWEHITNKRLHMLSSSSKYAQCSSPHSSPSNISQEFLQWKFAGP